ncbi:Dinucleotide-utilizing enzyme [Planctomycetales bacterium 10988]|nr:Dinucleotide-utilizing enzyme [Planctomycetales bacterium 10988]
MSINDLSRYSRQIRFSALGEVGQRKLLASKVLVCGCGALGTHLAEQLARAGVGKMKLIDRDFVDWSNLQRQVLFTEQDVQECLPKAIAAQRHLQGINSEVSVEAEVLDLDSGNIENYLNGIDLILDGTDNFETRYLINDVSIKYKIPWVFGGCLGAEGQMMPILPKKSACLRCLFPEPPAAGDTPTCDSAGILASIIGVVASMQVLEAIKILSGNLEVVNPYLTMIDLWGNRTQQLRCPRRSGELEHQTACPTCGPEAEFPWLEGKKSARSQVLCGRNSVQISPPEGKGFDLDQLAAQLSSLGSVQRNPFLLRFQAEKWQLTIFPDGRTIIKGTEDLSEAKSVFTRFVGL